MNKKYRQLKKISNKAFKNESLSESIARPKRKKGHVQKAFDAALKTVRLAIYLAGAVVITGESVHLLTSQNKVKNNKNLWQEAEALDIDTDMITEYGGANPLFKSTANKLPHNGKEPIYVAFSEIISDEDKKIYLKALNYYEELFKNIDDRYRFEEVSLTQAYMRNVIGQSVITFNEKETEGFYGYNNHRNNLFKWDLIRDTSITISNNLLKNDNEKYSVIVHELAHSFGFGDGYLPDAEVLNADTFMFASMLNLELGMLYPNDVKLLHLLYNKNLTDDSGNFSEEELVKIDEHIKEYETKFYENVSKYLQDKSVINDLDLKPLEKEVLSSQKYEQIYFYIENKEKVRYGKNQFEFDFENNKVIFKTYDYNNQLVYETESEIIVKDDIIYIPKLSFEKGAIPQLGLSRENKPNETFFAIFNTDEGYHFYNFATDNAYQIEPDRQESVSKQNNKKKQIKPTFELSPEF